MLKNIATLLSNAWINPAPKHSKMFSRNRYLSTLKTLSLQLNMMKRQDRPLYPMSPMKAQRQSLRMKKYAKILKPVTAHGFYLPYSDKKA